MGEEEESTDLGVSHSRVKNFNFMGRETPYFCNVLHPHCLEMNKKKAAVPNATSGTVQHSA